MKRIMLGTLLGTWVLVGCAGMSLRSNFQKNALNRAAFDLGCPKDQISLTRLDGGSLDAIGYSVGAQVGVNGCGKKAVYVLAPGGANGSWILNSDAE
jgi:hypothetical protein